jgi:hypothetical protein
VIAKVITGATGTVSKSFRQYLSNVLGKREIKELQKQPYCAMHTYCGKYKTYLTCETTLLVAQYVNTEQLQLYVLWQHGLLQVHNCKYLL